MASVQLPTINGRLNLAAWRFSEAQRLRSLEAENSKLKRLVADQDLDIVALKDILSKKW